MRTHFFWVMARFETPNVMPLRGVLDMAQERLQFFPVLLFCIGGVVRHMQEPFDLLEVRQSHDACDMVRRKRICFFSNSRRAVLMGIFLSK